MVASGTYVHLLLSSPCVSWFPVPAVLDATELSSNPKKPSFEFAVPTPTLYVKLNPRSVLVSIA